MVVRNRGVVCADVLLEPGARAGPVASVGGEHDGAKYNTVGRGVNLVHLRPLSCRRLRGARGVRFAARVLGAGGRLDDCGVRGRHCCADLRVPSQGFSGYAADETRRGAEPRFQRAYLYRCLVVAARWHRLGGRRSGLFLLLIRKMLF